MKFSALILSILFCGLISAQDFEGVVTYEISYDLPAEQKGMESGLPSETKMLYRDGITKSVQEVPATGGSQIVYTDNKKKKSLILMDLGVQKFAIESDFSDEGEDEQMDYKETGETKEIAGYTCKVAEAEVENAIVSVCYTGDLPSIRTQNVSGLEGFPLEIIVESEDASRSMTVVKIEEGNVEKLEFHIPDDYQVMSQEEWLQKMMSGGGM